MATTARKVNTAPAQAPELMPPATALEPTTNVVAFERPPTNPLDLPAEIFSAGLDRRKANRGALMDWIRMALVDGVDYGRIHTAGKTKCQLAAQGRARECLDPQHWSKPSLWKPGAEKICGMLGVSASFPSLNDYVQASLSGVDVKHIIIRCEILDSGGRILADGVGARSLTQDYGDINKALKMAEKSAHIDATLRMAGLSEVFTQDLEVKDPEPLKQTEPPKEQEPQRHTNEWVTDIMLRLLDMQIREYELPVERVKAWLKKAWGVEGFADLTSGQFDRLMQKLDDWKAAEYAKAEAESAASPCPF